MKGVVYIVLYIDDSLMIGDMAAIYDTITVLKSNRLVLKVMEGLQSYLSCEINSQKIKRGLGWDSPI